MEGTIVAAVTEGCDTRMERSPNRSIVLREFDQGIVLGVGALRDDLCEIVQAGRALCYGPEQQRRIPEIQPLVREDRGEDEEVFPLVSVFRYPHMVYQRCPALVSPLFDDCDTVGERLLTLAASALRAVAAFTFVVPDFVDDHPFDVELIEHCINFAACGPVFFTLVASSVGCLTGDEDREQRVWEGPDEVVPALRAGLANLLRLVFTTGDAARTDSVWMDVQFALQHFERYPLQIRQMLYSVLRSAGYEERPGSLRRPIHREFFTLQRDDDVFVSMRMLPLVVEAFPPFLRRRLMPVIINRDRAGLEDYFNDVDGVRSFMRWFQDTLGLDKTLFEECLAGELDRLRRAARLDAAAPQASSLYAAIFDGWH